LFEYISLSLFKEDRLTLAMQYLHQEAVSGGGGQHLFAPKEWELFTGVLQLPSENVGENVCSSKKFLFPLPIQIYRIVNYPKLDGCQIIVIRNKQLNLFEHICPLFFSKCRLMTNRLGLVL